jgi:hypothetical protein
LNRRLYLVAWTAGSEWRNRPSQWAGFCLAPVPSERLERRPRRSAPTRRTESAKGGIVARSDIDDDLIDTQQVVLVLRLTLDRHASLRHGELLDAGAMGQGRFMTLSDMSEAVQQWLDRQREDRSRDIGSAR